MTWVLVFPSGTAATAGDAACFFKLLTSAVSSAFCFANNSTARSSFSIRAVSDDDCARSGCAVNNAIAARLAPAARKMNFLVNMSFSLVFDGLDREVQPLG